ncbi:hypothetical protein [Parasitella parasitica]|uniref:Uncharacterized protein n=1 Tax=Parasitella parasitica TaxID=35722 RepID=A0A0B7NBC1_9FUNG|nr:hypothetical protein [Parasitella parasitica]
MDYVECVTFSLQVGVFFLMQSFWNYLSNTVARKSFMGSFEFKFYIVWALGSMAMFPILQWVFRNDVSKREGIPQLAYGIEALITSLLGIRSHFRFKRIIAVSQRNNSASYKAIVARLTYFRDMNVLVSIILFCYATSFIILCSDGLTEHKIINSNKFATDTIIANANICTVFLWLLLISIFHPRPQYSREIGGTSASNNNDSSYTNNTQSRAQVSTDTGRTSSFVVNESTRGITENIGPDGKYIGTAISTNNSNTNSGGFMRAMSPVTVDYLHSLSNDTMPLTLSTGSGRPSSPSESHINFQQQRQQQYRHNLTVQVPYSSQPVVFSMMDVKQQQAQQQQQQARYGSPTSPAHIVPMRSMNSGSIGRINTMSSSSSRYDDDEYIQDYEQTRSPQRIRRPSWERSNDISELAIPPSHQIQQHQLGQPGEQIVRDWLWQSPDRRNT